MFGFLSEMMVGQHEELPRRRVQGGITFEKGQGFVADEHLEHEPWPGRGAADSATAPGVSVAEEMRELTQPPADRSPGR